MSSAGTSQKAWDPAHLAPQPGKTFVVTGAGRGIGYFEVEQLAATGARVVMTTRSPEQGAMAEALVREYVPNATLELVTLDLASLDSIRDAAAHLRALGPIDVLINNAGRTNPPKQRETTPDGLEMIVGTNAFGTFALTALVFPALAEHGRVVSLGSLATTMAKADVNDLQSEKSYSSSRAYATSKHLTHAFAFELDRRLRAHGSSVESLLAHPGFAVSGTAARRAGVTNLNSTGQRLLDFALRPMSHGRDRGAWPVVRAALDPDAVGGDFFGPSRSVNGPPVRVKAVAQSADPAFGEEFWRQAEAATGVTFSP